MHAPAPATAPAHTAHAHARTHKHTLRAARSASWGVPEVEQGCREQLEALPKYRASISAVLARVASAHQASDAPRYINKSYLLFFLPLWWEHILERGVLELVESLLLLPR